MTIKTVADYIEAQDLARTTQKNNKDTRAPWPTHEDLRRVIAAFKGRVYVNIMNHNCDYLLLLVKGDLLSELSRKAVTNGRAEFYITHPNEMTIVLSLKAQVSTRVFG